MSSVMLAKNVLEAWIQRKIGSNSEVLTAEQLAQYQLQAVQNTIHYAYQRSPFYRTLFKDVIGTTLCNLADLTHFPFTTAEQIKTQALQFLCVSQSDISRIVTLDSSGTTGMPKRIYFTAADQELTIDFFQQGMSTMIGAGDRVLILLPGERSGSVGDLLRVALERVGAEPIQHGVVRNITETLAVIKQENIDCVVGIPTQVLALARYSECLAKQVQVKKVLLSTDHVPDAISQELRRIWNCQVFEHYGMTEMGLGGGLDCEAHDGYHLREADFSLNPSFQYIFC